MSVLESRRAEIEKYTMMMGETNGRLAVTLDCLTDALILVGQHGIYCTSARNPGIPSIDVQAILGQIVMAKELIAQAMEDVKKQKEAAE